MSILLKQFVRISLPCLFLLLACKKNDIVNPATKNAPTAFMVVNEGDSNIDAFIFYTYAGILVYSDILPHDTLRFIPNPPFDYSDPITKFRVRVDFHTPVFSPLIAEKNIYLGDLTTLGYTYTRKFESDTSFQGSASERIVLFRWPSDTLRYKEYFMD